MTLSIMTLDKAFFAECSDYLNIMLSVVMLSVVVLSIVVLSIVAPQNTPYNLKVNSGANSATVFAHTS
jgi:hypothetical protein